MAIVPNNQSFSVTSGVMNASITKFKVAMDGMMIDGPDFTIDLEPAKTRCLASCKFSMPYKKYIGTNGDMCRSCAGQGFTYETRQTVYKCNRRWTSEPFDKANRNLGQKTPAGVVYGNFVRIKTVIESFDHIQNALGATIDGVKVKLFKEPRQTGWGNRLLYVVSWWERTNKKVSNG